MQLFVRLLDGSTVTLDVDRESATIGTLRQKLSELPQFKDYGFSPRFLLHYGGQSLNNDDKTLKELNIRKEATLETSMRCTQQIYVNWNGKWIRSKEHRENAENFWHLLCKDNLVQSDWYTGSPMIESIENLTVWHLKKVIAKYILLGPEEIDLWFYNERYNVEPLTNDVDLGQVWKSIGRDVLVRLSSTIQPFFESKKRKRSAYDTNVDQKTMIGETTARRVYVESPYSGDIEANVDYAIRCMRDCLKRGEAPFLSHLLYTQAPDDAGFVPDDNNPKTVCVGRDAAIKAAESWRRVADCTVVYTDRGYSRGMNAGIEDAISIGQKVEYRALEETKSEQ